VSYEKMWRTGANKVTKITFDENCVFGGAKIKKGSYSLFTIPGKKEWTVVLNKNTELWGVGEYDKEKQVCSIVAKVIETKDFTESFTIDFGTFQSFSAIMSLKWANTKIGIKIESLAAKELEKQFVELLTKGPSANDYYNGAKFFVDNTSEYDMALEWINTAIEKKPDAFWMKFHKARILKKIGNNKQSISVAEEVISLAKEKKDDYGYIKRSEDLIKSIKSK
jgi:tetratricopeptide (TPR) repeat protein